jgi:hypothetical protein
MVSCLADYLIRNQQVGGSSPLRGSGNSVFIFCLKMALNLEWINTIPFRDYKIKVKKCNRVILLQDGMKKHDFNVIS